MEEEFIKLLEKLEVTIPSIQSCAKFMYKRKNSATTLVEIWYKEFMIKYKDHAQHRLNLLYLMNEVMQSSVKNHCQRLYIDAFSPLVGECFKQFFEMADETMSKKVHRIVDVWAERNVLEPEQLQRIRDEMNGVIASSAPSLSFTNPVAVQEVDKQPKIKRGDSVITMILKDDSINKSAKQDLPERYQDFLNGLEKVDSEGVMDDLINERVANTATQLRNYIKSMLEDPSKLTPSQLSALKAAQESISQFTVLVNNTAAVQETAIATPNELTNSPVKKKKRSEESIFENVTTIERISIKYPVAIASILEKQARMERALDLRVELLEKLTSFVDASRANADEYESLEKITNETFDQYSRASQILKDEVKRIAMTNEPVASHPPPPVPVPAPVPPPLIGGGWTAKSSWSSSVKAATQQTITSLSAPTSSSSLAMNNSALLSGASSWLQNDPQLQEFYMQQLGKKN